MLAHPAIQWCVYADLEASNGYGAKMSPCHHCVPLPQSQHHVINSANPRGALDDGVEHRLHIGGRATDNAKHLGRCRLMFQCLAQFPVTVLDLLEHPNVLDRNHSLIGEKFRSAICFSVKGFTSVRLMRIEPMGMPSRSSGAPSTDRLPSRAARGFESENSSSGAV